MGAFGNVRTLAFGNQQDNDWEQDYVPPKTEEKRGLLDRVGDWMPSPKSRRSAVQEALADAEVDQFVKRTGGDTYLSADGAKQALDHYIQSKRVALSQDLNRPTWGPKIRHKSVKRGKTSNGKTVAGLMGKGERRRGDALEPENRMHAQDQEISYNLEQAQRYHGFRALYLIAAIASFIIVAAALTVDYSILKEFWHQAMMNEYMMVPAELQDSVSLKALQVLFATIGIHLVLRHMPQWMVTGFTAVIFVMTVFMMIAIGFLYAHKTLPVENQATVKGETTENSGLLDALSDSGITLGNTDAAMDGDGTGPIGRELSAFFDAETLAWIDAAGWLVALTAIFFVVASIGALFLMWGEHNISNFILARDYKRRATDTQLLRDAEAVKLQIG